MPDAARVRPPILFLHIGWASLYRGDPDDPVRGQFGYLVEGNEDPGEALNFRNYDGRCFGYAAHWTTSPAKLGGDRDDEYSDGVLVVWTATNPDGSGRFIVGWYSGSRVYADMQNIRPDEERPDALAVASFRNCHVVPVDDRTFYIPSMVRGWPGRPRAWYPDDHLSDAQLAELLSYIEGKPSDGFTPDGVAREEDPLSSSGRRNLDINARFAVEKGAELAVARYYEARGWKVDSVGDQKLGWDLNVTRGSRCLRVEVKGRSGEGPVELTPREYKRMRTPALRMSYRVAIVYRAASSDPTLTIFQFAPGLESWIAEGGEVLSLREKPGAVASF